MRRLEILPVPGIPEVKAGSDIGKLAHAAMKRSRMALGDGDVVVVKQKVVSKAEGRLVRLSSVVPSAAARRLAEKEGKDSRLVQLILDESVRVVRSGHGVIITETRHGFVCANSGVDQSNVGEGLVALLPLDPDKSARKIRQSLESATGRTLAVIVTDTFGRPWRKGQTDVAIGCSGISPLLSYAGRMDAYGYPLRVTEPSVADEIAGAAELAMGKLGRVPVAVVRGAEYMRGDEGAKALVLEPGKDLFR